MTRVAPVFAALIALLLLSDTLQAQRTPLKLRRNSILRKQGESIPAPDPRGGFERRRDAALMTHYGRMATLDHVTDLATKAHNLMLLEKVESLRRLERRRFRLWMVQLRRNSQAQALLGVPLAPPKGSFGDVPTPGQIYAEASGKARIDITADGASAVVQKLERRVRREMAQSVYRKL